MPLPTVVNGQTPQCQHIKANGERCGNGAAVGHRVCWKHGLNKAARAAGYRRVEVAKQEARLLKLVQAHAEVDPDISVQEQYQRILGTIVAWLEVCQQQVESLDTATFVTQAGDVKLSALVALFERSMDRAAKVLADAQHLKLDETRVRIEAVKKQKLADLWSKWVQSLFKILKKRLPDQATTLDQVLREDVPKITRDALLGEE